MTRAKYDLARERFLTGQISWTADTFKALLVDSTYTYSASHQYLSDVPASARVATSGALTGKTATAGAADANDVTVAAVGGTDAIAAVIVFRDTGVESTSELICYIDEGTNIPLSPNGGDVQIVWDNGADKIFRL